MAAAIALGWANSPWAASYRDLWHTPLGIRIGAFSFVAGVGFTMALFIAQLAFDDPRLLAAAKLGVLGASGAAAILGLALGRLLLSPVAVHGAAQTADDAERSTEM